MTALAKNIATRPDDEELALAIPIEPLTPTTPINAVSALFLEPRTHQLLSLPVVDKGRPVGVISRYELMKVYMKLYGREVYGRRPVKDLMNPAPLLVPLASRIEVIAQQIITHMHFPVTDDFVLIDRRGNYHGMGAVVDVLKAMEQRMERKNLELAEAYENLKSSQTRLIHSEKMASLGQMVAGVAHEINTPLGYVRNNVEMLQELFQQAAELIIARDDALDRLRPPAPDTMDSTRAVMTPQVLDDVRELFRDTLYGAAQIAELVVSLRNFSRLDQASVENVNLNECLDSALVIARNNLKHKAEVVKQYGALPPVRCAPSQINQVFLNLLNNAAQAIEEKGLISIRTWQDGDVICASVTDDGRGIAPEHLNRIFDPFFTTKPIGEGTGLGLSISYQIIDQHHGRIDVDSQLGQGTTFTVRLPGSLAPPHNPEEHHD